MEVLTAELEFLEALRNLVRHVLPFAILNVKVAVLVLEYVSDRAV